MTPAHDDRPSWLQRTLCKECFEPSSTPSAATEDGADAAAPDPEGVAALLAIATDAVEDERERGRQLDNKCASLAGFTGLILSITGVLTPALVNPKLGHVGQPVAEVAFAAGILSLLAAVLLAVEGVLMPQKYRSMGAAQVANFGLRSVQSHNALWVHQSMLGALSAILAQDRPVNNCKAKLTRWVARCLAVGFTAVAIDAVIIATRKFGL
jgi:hypothetical protein